MTKYFYSLILLSALAVTGAAQSLNVLTYGADPTGAADSWMAFQKAIDDAGKVGRGFGGSGVSGSDVVTINPTTGTNPSWQQFASADVGKQITIEANTGLAAGQYYLLIASVISPTQCTVKSWNNTPVSFVNGFSGVRVLWYRGGTRGGHVAAPPGNYKISRPLEILASQVGLIGEWGNVYTGDGTKLTFTGMTPGIIEIPLSGKDTYWMERGAALIGGGSGSYRIRPGGSPVSYDLQDLPHVANGIKDSQAFTVEAFVKLNALVRGDILSFAGSLPGGTFERAFTLELDTNLKLTARVNLDGVDYIRQSTFIPSVGTVYHVALQFSNGELALIVDGVNQGSLTGLNGKKLQARPYMIFSYGGWRQGWPGGGMKSNPADFNISHLRLSNTGRYSFSGFTPPITPLSVDVNTLALDEADASQEKLFTFSLAGRNLAGTYERTEVIKHGQGGWGFNVSHKLSGFAVYAYGCPLFQRQTIGSEYTSLGFHTWNVGLYAGGDTFNNTYRQLSIAGTRAGLVNSGPAGIVTYSDLSVTGGQIGAWLSSGSGVISNWYIHGPSRWQLILDTWEGSIQGTYFSNEDVNNTDFQGNLWIGNGSDVTISGSKFETYAQPVPSVTIAGIRSATFINGMFEPHASAAECVRFTGTQPKSKVVLINPNHGRWEGIVPQTNVPYSITAPAGKLAVIQ